MTNFIHHFEELPTATHLFCWQAAETEAFRIFTQVLRFCSAKIWTKGSHRKCLLTYKSTVDRIVKCFDNNQFYIKNWNLKEPTERKSTKIKCFFMFHGLESFQNQHRLIRLLFSFHLLVKSIPYQYQKNSTIICHFLFK